MKNIKVSDLKAGNVFAEDLIRPLKSYKVIVVKEEVILSTGSNMQGGKTFRKDQEKQVILLREI